MEVNINQPRSRAFTIFLRFLQLALQLIIALQISKIGATNCTDTMLKIGQPVAIIMLIFNVLAIAILRCREGFDRRVFFVAFGVDIILAGVAMVVGFGEVGQSNSCAANKILSLFTGLESLIAISISILALLAPFQFAQRYCNAPGNFVWVILFFCYPWTSSFAGGYITVGLINLLIVIATIIVNILPIIKGMTKIIRKIIRIQWIVAIGLMAVCIIIVFIVYISGSGAQTFWDEVAKKLAQTYFPVNIIDAIFWIWGLSTLKFHKGDTVRDGIIKEQSLEQNQNDLDNYAQKDFGTIK